MTQNSNHDSPGRKRYKKNKHNVRQVIRRETRGVTRNLSEDFTGGDWSRLEARARAAMSRNSRELTGRETTGQTGRVAPQQTGRADQSPARARQATYVWTEQDQWAIVDAIREGLSARDIRKRLFPNLTPGSVTQEVQLIRQHMRDTGADMGAGADPERGPRRTMEDGKRALEAAMNGARR